MLYNGGAALQALEAREVPRDHSLRPSLIGHLLSRPRWAAGTALAAMGWPLQAAALTLAPLTIVQPALASGLLLLLAIGARALHERVGARELVGDGAIVGGVGVLAWAAGRVGYRAQHVRRPPPRWRWCGRGPCSRTSDSARGT